MKKAKGKGEDGVVDAIVQKAYERLGLFLKGETEYLAGRIAALNRRACLYKGKPCAVRARSEITGMVTVLSALGWEVDCDWDRYDSGVAIVPVEIIAEEEGGEGWNAIETAKALREGRAVALSAGSVVKHRDTEAQREVAK